MGMIRWVVELDPTNDFQLFIRALEFLRYGIETDFFLGMEWRLISGWVALSSMGLSGVWSMTV